MAHDIGLGLCLHPDLVDEVIEELFATEIISKDKLKRLKNDVLLVDPNLMMDIRHKEVKKESLIDFATERKTPEVVKRKIEYLCKEQLPKVKDLKAIDKEILNTRKCLAEFQNKLEKKNEYLTSSILDLEKETANPEQIKEVKLRDYPCVKLNEQETAHNFNFHLDRLEDDINKNQHKDNIKIWRPNEIKSPVINVITTFKGGGIRSIMAEENNLLEMCDLNSFQITGKSLETPPEMQTRENNDLVPHNSPTFSVTLDDKYKLTSKQKEISQKVLKTWKLYVKRKKILKWSEGKKNKLRIKLFQKYLYLWIFYTKQCKAAKATIRSSDTLQILPAKCCINPKKYGQGNLCNKAEPEPPKLETPTNVELVKNEIPELKNKDTAITFNNSVIPSKEKKGKCSLNNPENTTEKIEVHVKTVTPQEVGLVQHKSTNINPYQKRLGKRTLEAKENMSSRSMGEPLLHRFEAQEKIIQQQRELIEKQKRLIFDLQAKCIEIESKLNWTLAERQLAEAESQVTKGCVFSDNKEARKSETKNSKHIALKNYDIKTQDKSDIIVKNMLERQAYCSQLAAQTKMRKKRLEEERQRLKLEQEEKEKIDREEERKKRILQMKIEQQITQERERNIFALKKREAELVENSIKHYRNNLLRRCFTVLKKICLNDVSVKSEDCDRIYRQKLIQKMFNIWKTKIEHSIQSKYQLAQQYYHERLLRMAWDELCKVHQDYKVRLQVSEDLYSLKLQERMFCRWQAFAAQQLLQNCCKFELAERLHRRQLLRCYFHQWKELPRLMFKEREKEQRRRAWRHTVQQLIPDFTPAYVDEI